MEICYEVRKMKTINVTFTDVEYAKLVQCKNGANWHDFIMKSTERRYSNGKNNNKRTRTH